MVKKIFYGFLATLLLLLIYYFITKVAIKDVSTENKQLKSVSQIRERQELELAIQRVYEEAGEELSVRVKEIIYNAKEDMNFILTLNEKQVVAINRIESQKYEKSIKTKYMALPNFRKYIAGAERKEIFFKYFLYLIEKRDIEILNMRKKVINWKRDKDNITDKNRKTLLYLADKYEIKDFKIEENGSWNRLLSRLDIVPPSLALAQGAKESLWGTSRFARYGYNYFGQRCFTIGCGIVPKERGNRKFEVETFSSPRESLNSYIHNINTHFAYKDLRKSRSIQRAKGQKIKGLLLVKNLEKYSERGSDYIKELKSLIRYNKLYKYDIY